MLGADIRSLIGKLNTTATQAIYNAGGLSVSRTHYEVAAEHFLLKCLEDQKSDISICVNYFKLDRTLLFRHLNQALENFTSGNTARPTFSPILLDLIEAAWVVSSVDLKLNAIRTGAILIAYLRRPSVYGQGGVPQEITRIPRDELEKNFLTITADSEEAGPELTAEGRDTAKAAEAGTGGESFIRKFCEDFTQKASLGKLDPVFGRDKEIRSMVNILARRRKNNPILVGEPGVGKTAVMEGLAARIHEGDVPLTLKGVSILGLDMGLLEAGASMKGEFERRLKGVIDEVIGSPKPIILFIDEAHTLIGAGGSPGGSDAANLLKPALARGELRTCAATTFKEYKKYFEKDAALARRFQPVILEEPDSQTAALILRGLRPSYEKSHGVIMDEGAIIAAAEYADRYISGRYLPDKAVDLMDTACARVKVGLFAKPAPLEDLERKIQASQRELKGLERDLEDLSQIDFTRRDFLQSQIETGTAELGKLHLEWERQKTLAQNLIAARSAYLNSLSAQSLTKSAIQASPAESSITQTSPPQTSLAETPATALADTPLSPASPPQALKEALDKARAEYLALGPEPLLEVTVTQEVVARVVSDWTGIPLGRIAEGQAALVKDLEKAIGNKIKGQDAALHAIAEVIRASKAGLKDPRLPMGVFLLVGPSGVGKTETALTLAELLFGDQNSLVTINMSEFQEKFTVTRLIGSPPGYVGYGEGGLLTEAVRLRPYSVVLLDEVEKAHLDVLNLFYQVFDKGELTDGEGKKVNFRNTLLILTSNLASQEIEDLSLSENPKTPEEILEHIRPILNQFFRPALLARMNLVPFVALGTEALTRIAILKLNALKERVRLNNGIDLRISEEVAPLIASRCLNSETGARNIDVILGNGILPTMSQKILGAMTTGEKLPDVLNLSIAEDQNFVIEFA
ncbi:MAG: type VI secretion system ATPase TssH [Deltaproteobacteria bacterium]|jgi:type VI secretion system protein VasG|nr:type VI secretion system ATPase TssH [Deltaproteobacteria bacterium]